MLFDDDEFSLSDEDLAEDTQLSIVEEAKLRLVKSIGKVSKELENNIKFNEKMDANSNLNILNGYLNTLTDLYELDTKGSLSEEEIYAAVEEIEKRTTEITLSNLDEFTREESTSIEAPEDPDDNDDLGF